MNNTEKAKRGPKEIFEKREKLVRALRAVRDGATEDPRAASRFLLKRMEQRELIEFATVQSGRRGRPAYKPVLTREGVALLATI